VTHKQPLDELLIVQAGVVFGHLVDVGVLFLLATFALKFTQQGL